MRTNLRLLFSIKNQLQPEPKRSISLLSSQP